MQIDTRLLEKSNEFGCDVGSVNSESHIVTLVWFYGDLNGLDLSKLYCYLSVYLFVNCSMPVQMCFKLSPFKI